LRQRILELAGDWAFWVAVVSAFGMLSFYILFSFWALYLGRFDVFQSMGAFGIASAVLLFFLWSRVSFGQEFAHQRIDEHSETILYLSRQVEYLHQLGAVLVHILNSEADAERRFRAFREAYRDYPQPVSLDEQRWRQLPGKLSEVVSKRRRWESINRVVSMIEVILVFVGTLQSGFGEHLGCLYQTGKFHLCSS
jgi:hypothetical protein